MAEQIISKRCSKCKQSKAISEFHKDLTKTDKLRTICKICTLNNQHHRNRTDKYRKQQRLRNQNEKRRQQNRKRSEKYDKKYPERKKAVVATNHAIRDGKLQPLINLKCVRCYGKAENYHHYKRYLPENYLDVIPVCRICHNELHNH